VQVAGEPGSGECCFQRRWAAPTRGLGEALGSRRRLLVVHRARAATQTGGVATTLSAASRQHPCAGKQQGNHPAAVWIQGVRARMAGSRSTSARRKSSRPCRRRRQRWGGSACSWPSQPRSSAGQAGQTTAAGPATTPSKQLAAENQQTGDRQAAHIKCSDKLLSSFFLCSCGAVLICFAGL